MKDTRRAVLQRFLWSVAGIAAVLLGWRSRAIQVATFLVAANFGIARRTTPALGPSTKTAKWPTIGQSDALMKALNPAALVTYHPEYHAFEPQKALDSLMSARELAAAWVRTDVRWYQVMPDGIHPNRYALAWYREYLCAGSRLGLKNMVVLSSPPAFLRSRSNSVKLNLWKRFVEVVMVELSPWCHAYQLTNEPNNPFYAFFSAEYTAEAITAGAENIRRSSFAAETAINISMEICGWRHYMENLLRLSGSAIDIVGLDHYPGTWTVGPRDRWSEVLEIADLIAQAAPGSIWNKRRLAVIETGFSTNAIFRRQPQQSAYFARLEGVLSELKRRASPPVLFGVYELCDADSSAGLDPEAHFGLLTSDLRPKQAFATAARLFASL